jgi:ribosomal protein S12 methylthiotransferase
VSRSSPPTPPRPGERVRTRDLPVFPIVSEGSGAGVLAGSGLRAPEARLAAAGMPEGPRIGLVTLGCDKNTVDSERMMAALVGNGARVTAGAEGAEVVIVNTCGFIEAAKAESVETILEACELKASGEIRAVVAVGCMVQRYKDELAREIPEVDLFLGLTEMQGLVPELRQRGILPPAEALPVMERPLRILSTETPHTSFLKISEGCDHTCAFCAIPHMRGLHRSAPLEALVAEARELGARGVQELNLISQDTTWYGRDLRRQAVQAAGPGGTPEATPLLEDLLEALLRDTDIPWFRLFYMYPSGITPELVHFLASNPRFLPYLDMPIQHGSDPVLQRMRRPERQATIRERAGWLRDAIPDLTLRTTVIVGFPGETEAEFQEMMELLEELRFERVGAFTYSVEEGTPAATMPDPVDEDVMQERLETLMELQREISFEANRALVGSTQLVLVDRLEDEDPEFAAQARTRGQAAEVDGMTRILALDPSHGVLAGAGARTGEGSTAPPVPGVPLRDGLLLPGSFVSVEIVDALDYDLVARVVR